MTSINSLTVHSMVKVYLVSVLLLSVALAAVPHNRAEEDEETTAASSDASNISEGTTAASSDATEGSETGSSDVSEGFETTVASSDATEGSETGISDVSENSETTVASSDISEGPETTVSSDGTCMCKCPCGGETTISVTTAEPEQNTTTKAPSTTTTEKPGTTTTASPADNDDSHHWVVPTIPKDEGLCLESDIVFNICAKDTEIGMKFKEAHQKCSSSIAKSGSKSHESKESGSKSKGSKESKESGSKSKGSKESKESGSKSKGSKESKESGSKSKGSKESKESGSKSKGSKESKESGSKSKGSKESKESGSKSKGSSSSSSSSSESEEGCDDEFDKILELFEAAWEMKSCVFKEMGWVDENMEVNLDVIKEDLNTLPDFITNGMEETLDMCSKKAENATIDNIFGNEDFDLKISSEEVENRSGSKESGSKSKESGSKSKGSKESKESKESGSKSKGSKESKESGSKSKGSKESKESGSKSKCHTESKESGSKSKGSKESGESSSSESGASSSIEDCIPLFDEDQINKIEEILQKLVFFHCIHDSFLNMCGKYIIGLITKEIKPPTPPCITIGGAQTGAKCTFPFITGGMEYHTCTFDGGYDTPWCATKVDKDGTIVSGNRGECPMPEEDPNCYPFPAFPETTTPSPNNGNNGGCGCDFKFTSISLNIHISFTIISGQIFNGFQCYMGSDGSFLYVNNEGYWVVGSKLGVSTTVFMKYTISKATINIPSISWMYFQGGSWIVVSDLYSIPQKDFDVSFNSTTSSIQVSFQMISGGFEYNGFPYYIGSDGSFMYVNTDGFWVCGTKLGDSASVYMINSEFKATITLPSMNWKYRVDGGAWMEDASLISLPQSGFDISFSSSTIHVSFVQTVTTYNGFPVYIGQDGSFMYVSSEKVWVVGGKLGDSASIWMRNPKTPATSMIPILDWTYRVDGGEWIVDSGLVSIPQKGQDLVFKSSSLSIQVSFTKITKIYNGFPVYIGSDGSFLYVNSENVWVVGSKLGDPATCWMKNTEVATTTVSSISWTYHVYGSPWVAVSDLVSIPQKGQDMVFSSSSISIHISYTKITTIYNGFPVFIGSDASFMWVSSKGIWVAGTTLGDEASCFMKNNAPATSVILSMSWWYRVVGGEWKEITDLYSLPQKGFNIEFTASGVAATTFAFPIGFKLISVKHKGYPVLIGSDGSFMFVAEGSWMIGPIIGEVSSIWMKTTETTVTFTPKGWLYRVDGGEWTVDVSITMTGEIPRGDDDDSHHWVAPTIPKDEGLCLKSDVVFNICAKDTEIGMKFKEAHQKCSSSVAKSGSKSHESKESGSKSKGSKESKESGSKSKGSKESKESGSKSKGSKESKESGSKSKESKESKESGSKSKGSKESKESGSKSKGSKESKESGSKSKGSSSSSSSESEEGCNDEFEKILELFEAVWEMKSCVFKEMGWVDENMEVNLDIIKDDLKTLPDFIIDGMEDTLDMCSKKAENATIDNIFGNEDFDLKISSEDVENRSGSKESGSKSKESKESGSKSKGSKESKESGSKSKGSKESKESGSKSKGSKESKESGSKSKGSKESKESGSKSKGSKESGESSSSESGASSSIEECIHLFDEDQINKLEEIIQKLVFFHCIHDSFLNMCGKYIIGLITKEIKPPTPPCITISGAQAGAKCTFPFKTRGMEYHTCTFDGGYNTPWCATKVDKDGTIVFGNWGECPIPEEDPNCYPFPAFPETTTPSPNNGNNGGCGCDFEFMSISLNIHISFTIISGQTFNGFPCYMGSDGSFMYVNSEGYWVVGTKLGVSITVFMKYTISKATINIPSISWMYFQSSSWIDVPDLYSIPQKDFDVSFNSTTSSIQVSFQMISGSFKYNNFPCYIGSDGSFMYVNTDGFWVCGTKLGDSTSVYMINSEFKATMTLPSMNWKYRVEGGVWMEDAGLISLPQSGFDVSFSSSTIHVSFIQTVTMYNGFPVYIGQDGSFMYVTSESVWVVGGKLGDSASVWMKNPKTPATSTLPTLDWTYRIDGGEWIVDSGLVSIPQKGQDLEFKSSSLSIQVSFTKITKIYNGFPVYIGSDGSFLYVSSKNVWVVGSKLGDPDTCWMKNTEVATTTIPSVSWTYHVYGSPWVAVSDLVSIPQKGQDMTFSSSSTSIHISYTQTTTLYNAFPIFIGSDGSFMWVSSEGIWVVGTTLGDEATCFMKNNAPATGVIPSMSWWFRVVGGEWKEITDLYSLPQKGFNIEFTASGAAASAFAFPIGFKLMSIKHEGYPVFIGSDGSFMFIVGGSWVIGPVIGEVTSIWMKTTETTVTFAPSGWMYRVDGGEWTEDASIVMTGEIPKGECITIAGGAQVGMPCVFPFIAREKNFTKPCTFEGGYSTPWCPTKLNAEGGIILGNWGQCPMDDPKCPNDGDDEEVIDIIA